MTDLNRQLQVRNAAASRRSESGSYNEGTSCTHPCYYEFRVRQFRVRSGRRSCGLRSGNHERVKAIYSESIGNPKYDIAPIPDLAEGGYLIRPTSLGANIVVHSATKWIDGQGTTIAGCRYRLGQIRLDSQWKSPSLTGPSESYHGLVFAETFGSPAFALKLRVDLLRNLGPALNPFGAFLTIQGLGTLSLRAQRHSDSALALAIPNAFGGVLSFGIKGGITAASQAVDNLRLASHVGRVDEAKTLDIHPASTTHQQLTTDEQLATGVTPDLIRVSVGIEHIDDIIADFEQALKNVP
ncbi:pyridoxal phosphate-dependent transferase [Pisolithus sp. B1]|nr:pyridoxal phosphate-dependent transferase [Pisolithus sp. B1]